MGRWYKVRFGVTVVAIVLLYIVNVRVYPHDHLSGWIVDGGMLAVLAEQLINIKITKGWGKDLAAVRARMREQGW